MLLSFVPNMKSYLATTHPHIKDTNNHKVVIDNDIFLNSLPITPPHMRCNRTIGIM